MGSGSSRDTSRFNLTAEDIVHECGQENQATGRHILVTGATSGIGIETARVLACAGAKVYLMGRDEGKVRGVVQEINEELHQRRSSGSVQGVLCDLNSLASVKQFAQEFVRSNTPLHALILNAGIFQYKFGQTVDGLEQDMGVNHIAHAYLTELLMPKLIRSAPSRIVIVSSELHSGPPIKYQAFEQMSTDASNAQKGWNMRSAYQQSKLANLLFARAVASRYKNQQVTAYSLHPGVIDTNLTANIPLASIFKMFFKKKTIPQGAATTVFCALKPGLERETGRYFDNSTVTDRADKWSNEEVNTFWNWTQKIIQERTANL